MATVLVDSADRKRAGPVDLVVHKVTGLADHTSDAPVNSADRKATDPVVPAGRMEAGHY